jgi:hypothetical protein
MKTKKWIGIKILWYVDSLLGKDLETNEISDPFLSNGSVKTLHTKYSYKRNGGDFYVVRVEELERRTLGQSSAVDRSSVRNLSTEAEE